MRLVTGPPFSSYLPSWELGLLLPSRKIRVSKSLILLLHFSKYRLYDYTSTMVIFSLLIQISKRKSDLALKIVHRPEYAWEHQNRPAREVAPIPGTTPKTFCESFI